MSMPDQPRREPFFRRTPAMLHLVDETGSIVNVSDRWLSVLGYDAEEVLGTPSVNFLTPASRHYAETVCIPELVRKGTILEHPLQFLRKDGEVMDALLSAVAEPGERGGLDRALAVVTDVSERVHAQGALKQSEASYRALVENATFGIYRSDIEGNFLSVNPALVEMLGYDSPAEVLDLSLQTDVYVDPQHRAELISQCCESDRITGLEVIWRRRSGERITVLLNGRVVRDPGGDPGYFEIIAEDVTERRALEEKLRQNHRMEILGELAGGLVHDFNNVLQMVTYTAQRMVEELPAELTELRADAEELVASAKLSAAMVRRLLSFTRGPTGTAGAVDATEIVRNMEGMLRRLLPRGVRLEVRAAPVRPARAESGGVVQIVLNLVANARDAIDGSGDIELEVRDVDLPGGGPGVGIRVQDNGAGMNEEIRERVFDKLFTTKPAGRGTGLGLSVVRSLVDQYGGSIRLSSREGEGTEVEVSLPAFP